MWCPTDVNGTTPEVWIISSKLQCHDLFPFWKINPAQSFLCSSHCDNLRTRRRLEGENWINEPQNWELQMKVKHMHLPLEKKKGDKVCRAGVTVWEVCCRSKHGVTVWNCHVLNEQCLCKRLMAAEGLFPWFPTVAECVEQSFASLLSFDALLPLALVWKNGEAEKSVLQPLKRGRKKMVMPFIPELAAFISYQRNYYSFQIVTNNLERNQQDIPIMRLKSTILSPYSINSFQGCLQELQICRWNRLSKLNSHVWM